MTVTSLSDRRRQVHGEVLRTIEAQRGVVRVVTETPDGAVITEMLTPEEAREWAEELIEAARDAESRAERSEL